MTDLEVCNLLADYLKEDASIPIHGLREKGDCQLKHAKIIKVKLSSYNKDVIEPNCMQCSIHGRCSVSKVSIK